MADQKDQESSSDSEMDISRQNHPFDMILKTEVIQKDTIIIESRSAEVSTAPGSTGVKSTEDKNSHKLPEDKEIQSSSEDEK